MSKEELLNKIKEIIDRPYNTFFVTMLEESERYDEIKELIKEIENE